MYYQNQAKPFLLLFLVAAIVHQGEAKGEKDASNTTISSSKEERDAGVIYIYIKHALLYSAVTILSEVSSDEGSNMAL
jgi:hypothetical protein